MFTGIIQSIGQVKQVEATPESSRLQIATGFPAGHKDFQLGESVAVNGTCLTVTEFTAEGDLWFFVSAETLVRTNLGRLKVGSRVNLERALLASERLSGHIVQGHVDGIGAFTQVRNREDSFEVEFEIPASLARYCVEKGSIALNGVSLTINLLKPAGNDRSTVGITLIPHTWTHTSFSDLAVGDPINVEVDVLAKYVEKLCHPYLTQSKS